MCGRQDVHRQSLEPSLVSIFTDTSVRRLEDAANTHVFNAAVGTAGVSATHSGYHHVIAAGSALADDSTAIFAVALQNAGLLIIKLAPLGSRGKVIT